jgi:hypothetical protein
MPWSTKLSRNLVALMPTFTSIISYDNPMASIYGLHTQNAPDSLNGLANLAHPVTGATSLIVLLHPLVVSWILRFELLMGIMTIAYD